MALHRLLARQLKKLGCDSKSCNDLPGFVQMVSDTYSQADDDREMLERSLRVSSEEVMQVNADLRAMMSALRESEEKYRIIFNSARVGILRSTFEGCLTDGNPTLARMLGYADRQHMLEGITNLAQDTYLHPEDRQIFLEALLAAPDGMSMEREFKRLDGSRFLGFITASLQRDEQGKPAFITGTLEDITERKQAEEALRESEEKYREVIENSTDALYRIDSEGRIDMISPSGVKLLGFASAGEMLGKPQEQFWMFPLQCTHMMGALRQRGEIRDHEAVLKRKDGTPVHVAISSWLRLDADGRVLGVGGIFHDITERKQAEIELQESARRFHSLFDNMTEGAALHSPIRDACGEVIDYRIEAVNRSFEKILDLRAEDVVGLPVTEAYGNDEDLFLGKFSTVALSAEPAQFETYLSTKGIHLSISIAPWSNDGISAIFFDITERKQLEEQLLFRALHDPLTGLANRTLCLDRIAQANERALRKEGVQFGIVFIDLDRFKMINDSLGHEAGDLLLREVAQRLLACTRKIDTVCRYGGDEFILVLEELSPAQVMQTIKRIRKSLAVSIGIGNQNFQIEASFGVAYAPVPGNQPEDLLRNANIALHGAKQRGRNLVVVYRPKMHKTAIQTMSLQSDMRRGLDAGEFFLVYQPLVCLETNRLSGFEALMRWEHPQRGLIRPVEFIPLAEKSGLIFELGQFAVARACKDMAALLRAQSGVEGLTVSVNISPRQFSRWGLAEQIEQALADNGLPPPALVLEITESSIMKYPEASANMLARLKEKGMGIAIDDFGTGYSSMSALQKLPLDRLKIDMSFVRRIMESDEDREIIRAIITLARSLHLKTVAEGIETSEQQLVLKKMGCDLGQGYLFSRPMPLAEVPGYVRQML
ncbi:MAG: hypothetical protein A2051_04600 [Desulfovibrionales bacterium GWA2_65_9]|nr:MAG: hypothetical protein A2051_04600 [Desulfovibrionales bacterium GWA2_65_9]